MAQQHQTSLPPPWLNTPAPLLELIDEHEVPLRSTPPTHSALVFLLLRISSLLSPAGHWAPRIEAGLTASAWDAQPLYVRKATEQVLRAVEAFVSEWRDREEVDFPADRLPQTATALLNLVDLMLVHRRTGAGRVDSTLHSLGSPDADISERTARRYGTTRARWRAGRAWR
ncbi:hypothetical protein JCM10450v2_006516 [Rhodotorula kratochvilovae]